MTEKRGKGRPKKTTMADYLHGGPGVAAAVFALEAGLGCKRGDLAEATRRVAAERRLSPDTVKRYASRYRNELREITHRSHERAKLHSSIVPFALGLPPDVRQALGSVSAIVFATLLQEMNLRPGQAPNWLLDCVRHCNGAQGDELMALLMAAAPR